MSAFPSEIVELIIDEARSCPSTLTACSLVCRQWLPRARYHAFSSIHLEQCNGVNGDRIATFIPLLESPLATFISSVRQVHIFIFVVQASPVGNFLSLLARRGVAPKFLALQCRPGDLVGVSPLTSVTHARFAMGCFREMEPAEFVAITELVHGLPSLRSLALHIPDAPASRIRSNHLPPSLDELEINYACVLGTIFSLYATPLILPRLILRHMSQTEWQGVVWYLENAGVLLESLTLLNCAPQTVLSLHPALRHLTIGDSFRMMPPRILVALYSPCAANELETLTLRVPAMIQPLVPRGALSGRSEVDALLSDTVRWPRLRSVILCGGERDRETIDNSLRSLLPGWV
ncbi:hypothetical protein FB45DRAFT_934272 [Roridomyces roridus]|uniref:F-box domain-containing protein n=1 Tax=Roridomyces roridus TaxID=1738132 RepID=A0AAD7BBF6_9AGAR|nr:hypothetical protein FB45DRAFT_934272 [Roridomyces roridus]